MAELDTLDNGKHIDFNDVDLLSNCIRYWAGYADKILGKTIPTNGPFMTYTR